MIFFISFSVISLAFIYYVINEKLINKYLVADTTSYVANSKLLLTADELLIYIVLPVGIILTAFILINMVILIKYKKKIIRVEHFVDNINANTLNIKLIENFSSTELRILAKKINDMIDRLDLTFSRMRHFASIVSHELKTPLTIIRGELEIALHSKKEIEDYQVILASSLDEVLRLNNVVNALLDLSRAEEGRINMNLNRENISKLIEDIVEDAIILAESKNIQIESQIESNIFIVCDVARLHQAFLNLVDNAIKYTPLNGRLIINLKKNNSDLEISVSDTGHGIPQEAIPNIFDRFYRLNSGETKGVQGSGLGLSIVKWIVDAHKGRIDVSSIENQGSEFRVILPNLEK
jgi:signal transduction histidine kinase